jgi:hypothetical protein
MADSVQIPAALLDELTAAAEAKGVRLEALVEAWLRDRLIHEQEKQHGTARKMKP